MSYPPLEGEEQSLHEKLVDTYSTRPFSYDEVKRRFGESTENLQQTFAATVRNHGYKQDTFDARPAFLRQFEPEILQTLAGLRDAVEETDSWITTGFHNEGRTEYNGDRYLDLYREAMEGMKDVPTLTEERLGQLYDHDLLSDHNGLASITDKGWLAIYSTTDENVYWCQE